MCAERAGKRAAQAARTGVEMGRGGLWQAAGIKLEAEQWPRQSFASSPRRSAGACQEYQSGRPQKLSATPDLSGTVLPLCSIPNSALKNAPPFKSVMPK